MFGEVGRGCKAAFGLTASRAALIRIRHFERADCTLDSHRQQRPRRFPRPAKNFTIAMKMTGLVCQLVWQLRARLLLGDNSIAEQPHLFNLDLNQVAWL